MSGMVPVPAWLFVVLCVLLAAREFFSARRDEAVRDLFRMYLDATGDHTPSERGTGEGE